MNQIFWTKIRTWSALPIFLNLLFALSIQPSERKLRERDRAAFNLQVLPEENLVRSADLLRSRLTSEFPESSREQIWNSEALTEHKVTLESYARRQVYLEEKIEVYKHSRNLTSMVLVCLSLLGAVLLLVSGFKAFPIKIWKPQQNSLP